MPRPPNLIDLNSVLETLKAESLFLSVTGATDLKVDHIAPAESARNGALIFVDKKEFLDLIFNSETSAEPKSRSVSRPSVIVTSKALAAALAGTLEASPNSAANATNLCVIVVHNVSVAHALIKSKFAARDFAKSGWSGIHSTAIVHETAEIHPTVTVEPRAVIGAHVKVAAGVRIMAGAILENDVVIGENSILHPACVVGYGTRIGRDVLVGASSVIGSEGFGFAQDSKRRSFPIPHTGIVVLEDRVRIGAGCCIDRATYFETRIGEGTKLDNLCHVAHNVQIGTDCLLTSMFCVAGSTKIGNRVIASGQSGVIDHIKIADDVILLHRAGVTKDIDAPGTYAGLPTQPLADYLKNSAVMRSAVDLKKRVTDLEKTLATSSTTLS